MIIRHERPPLWDLIDETFDVAGKGVIFAWGDTIFNPWHVPIGPELLAHEAVHGARQGDDIEGWWRRYCADPAFRLAEEIPAHVAEYRKHIDLAPNRAARRSALSFVASRLADPLYGGLISVGRAKQVIAAHG